MNRYIRLPLFLIFSFALAAPVAQAAEKVIRLKLGTLAPAGTSYHKALQAMGEKWRKASDGAVQLVIFPGGTQGSEADMVGLMQTGNLDAGMLTTGGLAEIDPAAMATQGLTAWIPTIELSVNIRKLPQTKRLKCSLRTRHITCGILEADGEVWDEEGNLAAISRQIAQFRKE